LGPSSSAGFGRSVEQRHRARHNALSQFRRRKRIVAPDGSAIVPSSKPQPDGTLIKALARAWRWQRMLDEGLYTSVSEIGGAQGSPIGWSSLHRRWSGA
jgi:hypothetical protein